MSDRQEPIEYAMHLAAFYAPNALPPTLRYGLGPRGEA